MNFFFVVTFCLLQLSFGSEYGDATHFDSGHSEITSSILREMLNGPYIEVKSLLSKDSTFYIDSILSDINSTVTYDYKMHLRNIFENSTDEEELLKLSNFFFKLYGYLEMTLYEQFRGINLPNFSLPDFYRYSETIPDYLSIGRHYKRAYISLLVVNLALLKQRLGLIKPIKDLIIELITQLEMGASLDSVIEFSKVILNGVIKERKELSEREKEAFKSLLLFQKDLVKQALDCMKRVFKPNPSELVGCPFILYPYLIDGIIDSYQLMIKPVLFE